MANRKKLPLGNLSNDWGRWTDAHFQSREARDRFLTSVAAAGDAGWAAEATPGDGRAAQVRWRPGQFLRLNDMAYTCGGRILVVVDPHWA